MRTFVLIWIGQTVSLLGSGMFCLAQAIWVYTDLEGSITDLALISLCARLPGVLVAPLAGALVDRWDRKRVMIVADSVAAALTLLLHILVVSGSVQFWHLFVITASVSVASQFQYPAYFASIPMLVPKRQLGRANGMVQVGTSIVAVGAPFLAGIAITTFGIVGVILLDLGSFVFGITLLALARIPSPAPREFSRSLWQELGRDIAEGWRYLRERRGLLDLLVFFAVSNLVFHTAGFLIIPLTLSFTGATELGSALAIAGIGMLIGSAVMVTWGGPKRRVSGILGFMVLQGVALIFCGLRPSFVLVVVAYAVFAFTIPFVNACSGLLWQSKVRPELQGRVQAAAATISNVAPSIALVIAGPLADLFEGLMASQGALGSTVGEVFGTGDGRGLAVMFVLMGIFSLLVTSIGYANRRLRELDTALPDAIPDLDLDTDVVVPESATNTLLSLSPTYRRRDFGD